MSIKYFTPNEVLLHRKPRDLWLSFLGNVCDLSRLCQENAGDELLKPILAFGGKDVSTWFDARTGDLKTYIDPTTELKQPYYPHGRFLHAPPNYPASNWANDFGLPWWKNDELVVGKLSKNVKLIRVINVLSSIEDVLEVCAEETINDISDRYVSCCNAHGKSYTWKHEGRILNMNKTMSENGIRDDQPNFYQVNLPQDIYLPSMLVYFNDDLTEM